MGILTALLFNTISPPQAPTPVKVKSKRGAARGADNPMHQKSVGRYRESLRGETLTTPQLASRLGAHSSSNIVRTLYRMEALGLVKNMGRAKRTGPYGKAPLQWKWIGQ